MSTPLSGITTGATIASGDLIPFIDVSDTSADAGGTPKTASFSSVRASLVAAPGAIGTGTPAAGTFTALTATGVVKLTALPTDDPLIEGQLYNSSGAVKVSAGPPP